MNIYFPIESIGRELDAKLLTAFLLKENIGEITFAQHDLTIDLLRETKGGVYFGKNIMNPKKIELYQMAKKNGFSIVHLDEEGGVFQGGKEDIKSILDTRLNINSLQEDDYLLTWGEFQKSHYESVLESPGPQMFATGHLRFDLLKEGYREFYREEVDSIKRAYGDFILICTTFGFACSPYGLQDTFSTRNGYGVSEYKSQRVLDEWAEQMHKAAHFVQMTHELSKKFPDVNIVLRHHVAEDSSFYNASLGNLPNVIVNNSDTSIPWILAAILMIQNGSSTGLESYFCGTPVVNYEFRESDDFDSMLIRKIGLKCQTPSEVIEAFKKVLNGESLENSESFDELDQNLFSNLIENKSLELISVLREAIERKKESKNMILLKKNKLLVSEAIRSIIFAIKKPVRKFFFPSKHQQYLADTTSFSGFSKNEVISKLDRLSDLFRKKYDVRFISKRLFQLKVKS